MEFVPEARTYFCGMPGCDYVSKAGAKEDAASVHKKRCHDGGVRPGVTRQL